MCRNNCSGLLLKCFNHESQKSKKHQSKLKHLKIVTRPEKQGNALTGANINLTSLCRFNSVKLNKCLLDLNNVSWVLLPFQRSFKPDYPLWYLFLLASHLWMPARLQTLEMLNRSAFGFSSNIPRSFSQRLKMGLRACTELVMHSALLGVLLGAHTDTELRDRWGEAVASLGRPQTQLSPPDCVPPPKYLLRFDSIHCFYLFKKSKQRLQD